MEIILKKSKITNSILAQTITASTSDLKSSDVLGWCVYKKHKYIVLYDSVTNELRKYLMFKEVSAESKYTFEPFSVKVYFGIEFNSLHYQTKNELESQELIEQLEEVKQQAIIKGQFFL